MAYSDEILKYFIPHISVNIQRISYQKFVVKNLTEIMDRFIPMADTISDVKKLLIFLLKRFPSKLINDNFFGLMKFSLLDDVLKLSCMLMSSVDFNCRNFFDIWSEIGKGLVRLDQLKPRGFEEFHSEISTSPKAAMLAKLAFISSQENINFKILHNELLPMIIENLENEEMWNITFKFAKKVRISKELAIDWISDIIFLLKKDEANLKLIKLLEYIFTISEGSMQNLNPGRLVKDATEG